MLELIVITGKIFIMCHYTPEVFHEALSHNTNPWRFINQGDGQTFLEFFVSRGSNLYAVDNYGRNTLQQLFDDKDGEMNSRVPPICDESLSYLLRECPSLINQPDKLGIYPLHAALCRMRSARWDMVDRNSADVPPSIFRFDVPVNKLFAAKANHLARDNHGNMILHYLATARLGGRDLIGHEGRRLLRIFICEGVEPMVQNKSGRTALEMFFMTSNDYIEDNLDDSGDMEEMYSQYHAIGQDVVGQFEKAGYILNEVGFAGETLLHLAANLPSVRAFPWFEMLEAKGLDTGAKNSDGKTPWDIAHENGEFMESLQEWIQEDSTESDTQS